MIIVQLLGGLGNQMFQYAMARRLALKHQTALKLDITAFQTYRLRFYELGCFNIAQTFAASDEKQSLTLIKEPHFHFTRRALKYPDNVYIEGYWQSEKYFKDIESTIRQEFKVKEEPAGLNKEIGNEIRTTNSISIHVRRGDYVSNPVTNKYHGVCSRDYYQSCINGLVSRVSDPRFYVFSDAPEWTRENFSLSYPVRFVTHNGVEKAYEDLRLMSLCKHNILANSSFSWWAAWLNENPDKIVLAPKRWFNRDELDTSDLIPDSWICK